MRNRPTLIICRVIAPFFFVDLELYFSLDNGNYNLIIANIWKLK